MTQYKAKIRLFVPDDLTIGASISPDTGQAHYLGRVMRQKPGDSIIVFNGRDGEWRAEIDALGKNSASLHIVEHICGQLAETDVWLAFAPLKKSRTDFLVEKATELGVGRLLPVFTDHTDTGRVNTTRLGQITIEAAEQCERLSIPKISDPQKLADLIAHWPDGRVLLVADETGGGQPIADVVPSLNKTGNAGQPALGLLFGPEGGFSGAELDALRKLPFSVFIGLGPRILRAETAALATLACVQSLIGDWKTLPRPS